jgi:hypothetical protein
MIKVVRKTTKGDIARTILLTVQTAGILTVALLAPNVLTSLAKLGIIRDPRKSNCVINRSRNTLLRNGYLKRNTDGYLELTDRGYQKLIHYLCEDYRLNIPKIWDRKWRVIIFDIAEGKRYLREKLRRSLVAVGFVRLQASVWVFPYDCSDFISLLKADMKIGRDVLYMVVDTIEADKDLKNYFGIKQ